MTPSVDRAFRTIDRVLYGLNEWFAQPATHYCRLETSDDEHSISADDGSLLSMIELNGCLPMIGEKEFSQMIGSLEMKLGTKLSRSGHALQVVFDYDPDTAHAEVSGHFDAMKVTAKNLGLDIDFIMDDWAESVSSWCASERVWMVLWTRPFVLSRTDIKHARLEMGKNVLSAPHGSGRQEAGKLMNAIRNEHRAMVGSVSQALTDVGMLNRVLDAHQLLWEVRRSVDPEWTSRHWRALLPGDPLPLRHPDPDQNDDVSCLLYPPLAKQLFPREGETVDRRIIRVGDRYHAPIVMELPPITPMPFSTLFRTLMNKGMPYRASLLIEGDGLKALNWRHILTSILHFTSTANKKFNRAVEELKEMEMEGQTIVRLRAAFDTWTHIEHPNALQTLRSRVADLVSSVQQWGTCDVREVVGDPLLGFSATVPALMPASPAPVAAPPLSEALRMLPLTRPASPWKTGSVVLRTPDGKIIPFAPMSSEQAAWVDVGFAPMGGGKSVWLNTINYAFCLQVGLARLPWLSIIDIGPSSSGLITLLKETLPENRKHLAAYHRLRMTPEYGINPFDTPLGCQKPLPAHASFLVNFLSLLATPLDRLAPYDGVAGIARLAVQSAYEEFSVERNPKPYNAALDIVVAEAVDKLGIPVDERTSWWEVVDSLYENGLTHEASRAQRFAVPLLADVASMARRDLVTNMYKHSTPDGERITDYFWRALVEAINAYPILKDPTQFDIGEAQIVSLDLDEVAPRGGAQADRQSAVMYMLARHVVGAKFFMMPDDVKHISARYQGYHEKRIKAIREDPKRMCFDEVHRVARAAAVAQQIVGDIETGVRESRKWNLSFGLYSQNVNDIPDILVDLATNIFVLGAGSEEDVERVTKKFGLNDAAKRAISNLGKPGKHGANMLAIFKVSSGKFCQMVTSTIGMLALWAFSSTSEDVAVRNTLYMRVGVHRALAALARLYPGGIKVAVERRRQELADRGDAGRVDVIGQFVDELAAAA